MNKIASILLLVSFMNTSVFAQSAIYGKTDSIVKKLGSLENLNVATIADTITRPFAEKQMKARAIFYWIANNIAFDLKAMKANDNRKTEPEHIIATRKATALGYAKLFQEMCSMANIRCLTVDGYVKHEASDINNPADEINHTWNVVQLGQSPEQWYYADVAKASGFADRKLSVFTKDFTSEYFFADRTLFNLDHYPDNTSWQLGGGPKNLKEFYALPVMSSAAYKLGLQRPNPATGLIKTKTKNPLSFSFPRIMNTPVQSIVLITGEEKKQEKAEEMNFSDNGNAIIFTYQFKKEDSYPVRVVADGKTLIQYYVDVKE